MDAFLLLNIYIWVLSILWQSKLLGSENLVNQPIVLSTLYSMTHLTCFYHQTDVLALWMLTVSKKEGAWSLSLSLSLPLQITFFFFKSLHSSEILKMNAIMNASATYSQLKPCWFRGDLCFHGLFRPQEFMGFRVSLLHHFHPYRSASVQIWNLVLFDFLKKSNSSKKSTSLTLWKLGKTEVVYLAMKQNFGYW